MYLKTQEICKIIIFVISILIIFLILLSGGAIVLKKTKQINTVSMYCNNGVHYMDFGGDLIDTNF